MQAAASRPAAKGRKGKLNASAIFWVTLSRRWQRPKRSSQGNKFRSCLRLFSSAVGAAQQFLQADPPTAVRLSQTLGVECCHPSVQSLVSR